MLALSIGLAGAQERPTEESCIRHVTVVNVATGAELKDQTVRIQGNRIASIAATQEADASLPGVDARGAYLIPGLWDMHVHVHEPYELALYVANGVTGVRIMSGERDTAAYRAELARQAISPRIYLASAIVDGSSPVWPGSIMVQNAAEARRAVGEIKGGGADFIKVYSRLSREAYFALADEAKQQHIAFEGHVPRRRDCPGGVSGGATFHGALAGRWDGVLETPGVADGRLESRTVFSPAVGD